MLLGWTPSSSEVQETEGDLLCLYPVLRTLWHPQVIYSQCQTGPRALAHAVACCSSSQVSDQAPNRLEPCSPHLGSVAAPQRPHVASAHPPRSLSPGWVRSPPLQPCFPSVCSLHLPSHGSRESTAGQWLKTLPWAKLGLLLWDLLWIHWGL